MKPLTRLVFPALLLLALLSAACKSKPGLNDNNLPPDSLALHDPHHHWADSVLRTLTLEERIGQLILMDAPADVSEEALAAFAATAEQAQPGFLRVRLQTQEEVNLVRFTLSGKTRLPLLTAQHMDSAFHAEAGYPPIPALGRMSPDSTWASVGHHWATDANLRGVQLLLTQAGALSSPALFAGENGASFQGNDPERVSRQLTDLLRGAARGRVAIASAPIPSSASTQADPVQLAVHQFRPLRNALIIPQLALQASEAMLTSIDSLRPNTFSYAALNVCLREGIDFKGLLFSADLSEMPTSPEAGEPSPDQDPAVKALLAGCDVLVNPGNPKQTARNIAQAFSTGAISQQTLDAHVRRVLWMKSWTRLQQSQPLHPDSLLLPEVETQHETAVRRMVEGTLTLAANRNNMFPLRLAETRKVVTLAVGAPRAPRRSPFQDAFAPHFKAEHISLTSQTDTLAFATKLNLLLKSSDDLVVALYPSMTDEQGHFPRWLQQVLLRAQQRERLAVVTFAGEASLHGLDSLSCVLVADGVQERVQNLAGQAVLGCMPINGKLAFGCGRLAVGTGVEITTPIRLKHCLPEDAGFPTGSLLALDSILYDALRMEAFPGCQVFVAKSNKVVYHRSFGYHSYDRKQRVLLNDIYDVASVTKAASTTLMMMYAADRDTHLLNGLLREYIKDLDTTRNRLADITIDDLLVHQSGLPAAPPLDTLIRIMRNPALRDVVYSRKQDSLHQVQISSNLYLNEAWIDTLWSYCKRRTVPAPRGQYIYSDYNFFMLMRVLEEKFGHRLDSLVLDSIYTPLGLTHTGYLPLHRFTPDEVVPTEEDKGWRLEMLDGYVHDETAAFTGCVGGNAGLFSTSGELGILLQTLLNQGSYGGRQMFSPAIVRKFTSRSPHCYRALGWDMQTNQPKNVMVCESATPSCFGHIGYTGTAIWADPTHDIVFVFLSNRVHPTRNNWKINQYRIRQSLQQAVYEALGLHPPDPDCERASYLESNEPDSMP